MIDIVAGILGIGLNAALVLQPDWLLVFGELNVVLIINATLFLWLGLRALNYQQKLKGFAASRRDLQTLNEQTIRLNKQLEEQAAMISSAEQALAERTAELQEAKKAAEQAKAELEDARRRQAQAEKERQNAKAQQAAAEESQAELVQFLSLLQKHGRFLDFVMGDITRYPDDRVGAAARLVHQGCSKAIKDYFDIRPILSEDEGSQIELKEPENPRKIRFIGQSDASQAKKGRLIHRGWQTLKVDLPKRTQINELDRVIIAPAEIELKA